MNKGCYGGSVRVDKLFFCIKGQNYEELDSVIDTYLLRIGGGVEGGWVSTPVVEVEGKTAFMRGCEREYARGWDARSVRVAVSD